MDKIKNILRQWLPLAVVITAVCGLVYLAVQQELRQTANDPQIQIAEDAAAALENGAAVESIVPAEKVAIERSLAPFVMVFNDRGEVAGSSAVLHGQTPQLPAGVLEYVRSHGEDRITWQPEPDVRIAAVVTRYPGAQPGFVLAGRSLREVEVREDNAELEAGAAWIVILGASLAAVSLGEFFFAERRKTTAAGK
jgi:hypothetical protein